MNIDKKLAINTLVKNFPEFQNALSEFLNGDDIEGFSMCFLMFPFCDYVFDNFLKNYNPEKLDIVSSTIEEFVINGNEEVQYAATLCCLENIVNKCLHNGNEITECFVKHLGSEAKGFCRESDEFWKAVCGNGGISDALRYEKATGKLLGPAGHAQKVQDSIVFFRRWLNDNPNAIQSDIDATTDVMNDLQSALGNSGP